MQISFILQREFTYMELNVQNVYYPSLASWLFFHWYTIHQPVDLKVPSLTVRLQLILIYYHLNNQVFRTANSTDTGQVLLLHAEYEAFSQYNLPTNVCSLPSLAPQYTQLGHRKLTSCMLSRCTQTLFQIKIADQILSPSVCRAIETNKKTLNHRISFH